MSYLRKSAVKQTTQTLGLSNLVLLPNAGDTRSFEDALGAGPVKCRYMLRGIGYFVHLRGTFTAPDQLTRDEVIKSSDSGSDVSLPSGTTDVYLLDYAQFEIDRFSSTKTLTNKDASQTWIFTGGSIADLNMPAISSALPDFWGFVKNGGTADLTLKGNGSDTFDETSATSTILKAGQSAFVYLDLAGSIWRVARQADRDEEGSWTPIDSSGAGLSFSSAACGYKKIRGMQFLYGTWQFPATANGAAVTVGGSPFASSNIGAASGAIGPVKSSAGAGPYFANVIQNTTTIRFSVYNGNAFNNAFSSAVVYMSVAAPIAS